MALLVELLDGNHGYHLYQSVSRLKEAPSADQTRAGVRDFQAGSIDLQQPVEQDEFDSWISRELAAIETAVDEALADADLRPEQIDRVFLTGGTSFVPAVRALFSARFDPARIATGAELESIASGLALIGGEADLSQWCQRVG